jgi:hypothetical protein
MGFFEEHPIVFVITVLTLVEAWIRVREPLFRRVSSILTRSKQPE